MLAEFTEDKSQKLKKSAFEEAKKLSILLDAFRSISKNVINPEPKAEDFDSQNLFSRVKEIMDKSKSPASAQQKTKSSAGHKQEADRLGLGAQGKLATSFMPAVSEFLQETEARREEERFKKKDTNASSFRTIPPIREDNLFDSITHDDLRPKDEASPLLDFYQQFELGSFR